MSATVRPKGAARPGKPRCTAHARTTGTTCGAPQAVGDKCWAHGGANLSGEHGITFDGGQPMLWRLDSFPAKTGRKRWTGPKRASSWAALQLIHRGIVVRGVFADADGAHSDPIDRFFRRLKREGVTVVPHRAGMGVRVVVFQVKQ